jgi:hypothetical protein
VLRFARHEGPAGTGPSLFCSGVRFDPAIYDGYVADENFSADLAGAGWVNGSPVKPVEVGLGSAGGESQHAIVVILLPRFLKLERRMQATAQARPKDQRQR